MANLVLFVIERHAPRAVVLCFGAEKAAYRAELYAPYHADRPPMPPELEHQWEQAQDFFGAFGWLSESHPELEADDLLGSLATIEQAAGGTVLLFTGDRDMFQCVDEQVTVLFPRGGKDGPEVVDAAERARALRDRARAGARLHRPARRSVRRAARRQGNRREGRARSAARARHARRRHRGGLQAGCDDAADGRRADRRSGRAARLQGHRDAAPRRARAPRGRADGRRSGGRRGA